MDLTFYLITPDEYSFEGDLIELAKLAIDGGATMLQLRDKKASNERFIKLARELKKLTQKSKIPLIINDRVEAAIIVDADGLHLGKSDLSLAEARRLLGKAKILGASAHDVESAMTAMRAGADYLGIGPIFTTQTKEDATDPCGLKMIKEIKQAVSIPLVAIGGIEHNNAREVILAGADGLAVISAISKAEDFLLASRSLFEIITESMSERFMRDEGLS